ncbi:hypothetical protein B0A50_08016 [Salinomyces thailandicus]|uniref:Ribosome biogenesis regulatory protein n=1 Tax=Salinomyces thailandicus TaxID=706561 RepID=A0A4U0TKP8_9PEZI|nr:hypothetical protein B0A50_08016 [Salinomyces thailandica]
MDTSTTVDPVAATTPHPFTFDLGHLLCNDPAPLPTLDPNNKEALLTATAQRCAQGLINQLLTACPISRSTDGALQISLPEPGLKLPREKAVPKEKEKTKWERFAEKKGIKDRKRGELREGVRGGYRGGAKDAGDWMEEVDEKAERREKEDKGGKEGGKGVKSGRVEKGGKGRKLR